MTAGLGIQGNNRGELMKIIGNFIKEADDEKLRLLVKIVRAVIR